MISNHPLNPRHVKWTFLAVLFIFLSANLVFQGHEQDAAISVMQGGVLAFVALWWMIEDSRQRQFVVSALFKIGVVAISGVFIPAYLIRSRGIRAAFMSMGIFVLQLFGIMLASVLVFSVLRTLGMLPPP
jgi:hypothetical protein